MKIKLKYIINSYMITLQKNQKLKQKKYLWFTLVELIVVIVILAILATIAFLSFNSYSSSSRDSVRLADISNLNKWIELYNIRSWYYPLPEWTISTWTIFWVELTYKWILWDKFSRMLNINKTPVDPLSSSNYVYWISYDKKYFQIWVVLENSANRTGFFEDALAWSWAWNYFSKINWNYMWIIKFSTWTTNKYYYIANVPSLLYNNMNVDLLNTWTYYIADDNTNLAYQIDPNVTINNKTADVLIKDITNKSTATLTWVDITSIVNSTDSTTRTNLINSTFSWTILDSFWGNVSSVSSVVNAGMTTTTTTPIITIWSISSEPWLSCNNIKTQVANSSSWLYWIKPDSNPAFQVYCDMSSNGWWWTLVARFINWCYTNVRTAVWTLTSPTQGTCAKLSDTIINTLAPAGTWIFWWRHDPTTYPMTWPRFLKIISWYFDASAAQSWLTQQCSCSPSWPWSSTYWYVWSMAWVYNHWASWMCISQWSEWCTAANTNWQDLFLYQHSIGIAWTFPADPHGIAGWTAWYMYVR